MKTALQRHKLMVQHIKQALSTPSGLVLFQWLEENCFMNAPSSAEVIDSPGAQQRLNARRDLFITLQNILREGVSHDADRDDS